MSALAPAAPVAPDITSWTDRKLDSAIQRGHTEAGAHSRSYEEAAAVTGYLLTERKRRLPHGAWGAWLEKNFDGTQQTAATYMRKAAEMADQIENLLSISGTRGQLANQSGGTDAWSTPDDFFAAVDAEFGFELDVCALDSSAKCERYFTPEDNGLAQEWTGTCWMNPPYGDEIRHWVKKAHDAALDNGATVACLVPARVDTGWWWDYCRHAEIRFLRGRLRFGDSDTGAPFPSALVIFGRPARVMWWEWQ
jgi:phage N-6-adenine-methyltransferase